MNSLNDIQFFKTGFRIAQNGSSRLRVQNAIKVNREFDLYVAVFYSIFVNLERSVIIVGQWETQID